MGLDRPLSSRMSGRGNCPGGVWIAIAIAIATAAGPGTGGAGSAVPPAGWIGTRMSAGACRVMLAGMKTSPRTMPGRGEGDGDGDGDGGISGYQQEDVAGVAADGRYKVWGDQE